MLLETQNDVVKFLHSNHLLFARPELARRRDVIQKSGAWLVIPEDENIWGSEILIVSPDGSIVRAIPKGLHQDDIDWLLLSNQWQTTPTLITRYRSRPEKHREFGATATEYGVVIALLSAAALICAALLGYQVSNFLGT
jgi:hypothetical protein